MAVSDKPHLRRCAGCGELREKKELIRVIRDKDGRVSLDETERILKTQYPNSEFVCLGDDRRMSIFTTDESLSGEIVPFISGKTNLHNSAFRVYVIDEIPRNEYGKVKFSALEEIIRDK